MKYYLVGIKGTGMCSLACYLKTLGNDVIGSDDSNTYFTDDILNKNQIDIYDFGSDILKSEYIYIISSSYDSSNIDVKRIIDNHYIYFYYHDFIGNNINKEIIAVSGTHGKTTTAKFISDMIPDASCIIGDGTGKGTNSEYLILEACEYKRHFLSYSPTILVVTNIDLDHIDYYHNIDDIIMSFYEVIKKSQIAIVNGDCKNIKKIKHKNIIRVGKHKDNDIHFVIEQQLSTGYIVFIEEFNEKIYIPFLGEHYIYDYTLSYVTCKIIGINPNINNITLPNRRMKETKYGCSLLIDDYAHHPTEIKALYETLTLKYPIYKKYVFFQPHTYSRTFKFKKSFKNVLKLFDKVYIDDVYPSKREPYNKYKQMKVDKIFKEYGKFKIDLLKRINKHKKEIWIFLGAGTINKYIKELE